MTYLPTVDLGEAFAPFAWFQDNLGFIPNLFRAQSLLPRAIEAEAEITRAILAGDREGGLSRAQKECILLAIAGANQSSYCVAAHREILRSLGVAEAQTRQIAFDHRRAGLIERDAALLDFALKLAQCPARLARADIDGLRRFGLTDEQILDAILVSGLTKFMCTLSLGLGVKPDFEPPRPPKRAAGKHWTAAPSAYPAPTHDSAEHGAAGDASEGEAGARAGRLRSVPLDLDQFPPFAFLRRAFGFVPNIFRAQTLHPEALAAEVRAVQDILLTEDLLSRTRKEYLLLVVSAANLNTYCVAVHCGMLRNLGIPENQSDQIALDHRRCKLPVADKALLDFALRLNAGPGAYGGAADISRLRRHGFSGPQIVEAIVMTALTNFLNTIQMGLGPAPDFPPRLAFEEGAPPARLGAGGRGGMKPGQGPEHPTGVAAAAARASSVPAAREEDPDADCVAPAQRGDLQAFETLVRRHSGRLYQTLYGITGNVHDAEDGLQNAFIKAFRSIGQFRGGARFSTWLTRIAINEGLQRLRRRREVTSLDDTGEEGEFRPREVRDWRSDPEQDYSKAELRALVERALVKLPPRYRTVVVLRDLEQMSTEEAAQVLGLGVPALKTRLFRGRLMLREELARHFAGERSGRAGV